MKKEYFNCEKCRPPERPDFSAFETVREEKSSQSFHGIFLCKCPACKGFSLLDYSEDWDLAPFVSEYGVQVVKMFPLSENEAVLLMNEFDNGPIHVEEAGKSAAIPDDSIAMKCRADRPYFYTDGSTVASSVSTGYNTYADSDTNKEVEDGYWQWPKE